MVVLKNSEYLSSVHLNESCSCGELVIRKTKRLSISPYVFHVALNLEGSVNSSAKPRLIQKFQVEINEYEIQ